LGDEDFRDGSGLKAAMPKATFFLEIISAMPLISSVMAGIFFSSDGEPVASNLRNCSQRQALEFRQRERRCNSWPGAFALRKEYSILFLIAALLLRL